MRSGCSKRAGTLGRLFWSTDALSAGVPPGLADYPMDTLFVTWCAGPHCNGATRGAIRLARLGRPVKIMIGGITGWLDEGFKLDDSEAKL